MLANLLAMLVLAVPLHGAMRWLRLAAPAALLVAVAQVVAQGPRWQMVPAYVLAGLFFVVWLLNITSAGVPTARKTPCRFAAAAGIGLGLLGLVVSTTLPVVLPVFRFASPGGPYAIGTLTYHWVDTGRREIFATSPQARRELVDQLGAVNRADPNGILAARLDLRRAGAFAFGISLGGIVVGEVCRLEPRLRAWLVMDAPMPADVVQAGLQQPAMWITRDAATMQQEGWSRADIDQHQTSMRSVFERLPGDGYFVRVRAMFHANLMDIPYFSPLMPWLGVTGPIDPQRAHAIVNAYTAAFFDRHLRGRAATLLDGPASPYPEVLFESRRP